MSWRDNGVHRVGLELPLELWQQIEAAAKRLAVAPAHIIRIWLAERLEVEKKTRESAA